MSRKAGSVRIGPISILALIFTLCLAVLAVLSVTTANATYASAERQAIYNDDTHANEKEAQQLCMDVDEVLAGVRSANGGQVAAMRALKDSGIAHAHRVDSARATDKGTESTYKEHSIEIKDNSVFATFTQESRRSLSIELKINPDATFTVAKWQTSTLWLDEADKDTLWIPGQ